jgi:uncharacterized membrane protein
MTSVPDRLREHAVEAVGLLVAVAGLVGFLLDVEAFWVVWVVGFAVLLPLADILTRDEDEPDVNPLTNAGRYADREDLGRDDEALAALRSRYAEGELTEAELEAELDALLVEGDADADGYDRVARNGHGSDGSEPADAGRERSGREREE